MGILCRRNIAQRDSTLFNCIRIYAISVLLTLLSGLTFGSETVNSRHQSVSAAALYEPLLAASTEVQEQDQHPYSEQVGANELFGVLSQSRWGIQWRELADITEEESDSLLIWLVCFTQHHFLHQQAVSASYFTQAQLYAFLTNHRIAGWKESNALYVALNAHYHTNA